MSKNIYLVDENRLAELIRNEQNLKMVVLIIGIGMGIH